MSDEPYEAPQVVEIPTHGPAATCAMVIVTGDDA